MLRLSVPETYVNAFFGKVPKSVLARYYTDYETEKLKDIYGRTGLELLS